MQQTPGRLTVQTTGCLEAQEDEIEKAKGQASWRVVSKAATDVASGLKPLKATARGPCVWTNWTD